ncbi:hypothetical protein Q7P37_008487 [Cladosporium fusiforme]
MSNIRDKIKRKLSMHDKNVDFENGDHDDVDEETTGYLHREIERAEAEGHSQGRPNSFLNRLISHGNDKTEKQLAAEAAASNNQASSATKPAGQ